jgi:hypothetical protein
LWLFEASLTNLHLDATFGRCNQALTTLATLATLIEVFGIQFQDEKCLFFVINFEVN